MLDRVRPLHLTLGIAVAALAALDLLTACASDAPDAGDADAPALARTTAAVEAPLPAVQYHLVNSWGKGFQAQITLEGGDGFGWVVEMDLPYLVTRTWKVDEWHTPLPGGGWHYTFVAPPYSAWEFGFLGEGDGLRGPSSLIVRKGHPIPPKGAPADPQASPATRALFRNLRRLAANATIMFGQEFATDMGRVDGTNDTFDRSDVKDVVGQHPAVHGSDFHYMLYKPWERDLHVDAVKAARARGAVVVFDFHMYGRYEETFYATPANANLVREIVEDTAGSRAWYYGQLDEVIAIVEELGFPVVFRPFHEMSGNWFWWGEQVGAARYRALYRLTVDYFRARGVHDVLWAWSTNRTASLEFYPGDDYVDVVGTDGYEPGSVPWFTTRDMVDTLATLARFADAHGKVAAFTEVGHRSDYATTAPDFWTRAVLAPILADPDARHIAWIMTWINNTWSGPYVPYLGMEESAAIDDFVAFYEHPATLFEDDLPPMYE